MAKKIIVNEVSRASNTLMKQVIKENAIIIWLAMNALCGILMLCNKNCAFHSWSLPFFLNCCAIIWKELSTAK